MVGLNGSFKNVGIRNENVIATDIRQDLEQMTDTRAARALAAKLEH